MFLALDTFIYNITHICQQFKEKYAKHQLDLILTCADFFAHHRNAVCIIFHFLILEHNKES